MHWHSSILICVYVCIGGFGCANDTNTPANFLKQSPCNKSIAGHGWSSARALRDRYTAAVGQWEGSGMDLFISESGKVLVYVYADGVADVQREFAQRMCGQVPAS